MARRRSIVVPKAAQIIASLVSTSASYSLLSRRRRRQYPRLGLELRLGDAPGLLLLDEAAGLGGAGPGWGRRQPPKHDI